MKWMKQGRDDFKIVSQDRFCLRALICIGINIKCPMKFIFKPHWFSKPHEFLVQLVRLVNQLNLLSENISPIYISMNGTLQFVAPNYLWDERNKMAWLQHISLQYLFSWHVLEIAYSVRGNLRSVPDVGYTRLINHN